MRMAEGEREVLWADQSSADASQDTSAVLLQSQRNILDTMVMYCSPTVKKESPLGPLGGILTKRSCLGVAPEVNSSDADSSVTGVSCYSPSYSPRLLLSERRGAEVGLDQNHRALATCSGVGGGDTGAQGGGGDGGRGGGGDGGESIPLREPPAIVVEEAGLYGLERDGPFKNGSNTISSASYVPRMYTSLDHSRAVGGVSGHAPQPAKPSSSSHLRRPGDSRSQPGHTALLGTADLPKPSSGSAFRSLSQQHHAPNLVRRSSSLSRATMIKSPPLSRSHPTVTGAAAAATTDTPAATVASKAECKALPPPTPHISVAASNRNAAVGFDDNFVSPMVLKGHGGRAGPSAFSRPADQGCSSLTLSPPQRRVLDTGRAPDLRCAPSTPPLSAQVEGNKSASSLVGSLPSAAGEAEGVSSPIEGIPPKDRSLPSVDLNSTFTIASLSISQCGTSPQGQGFRPLSTLASSSLTTGTPILAEHRASLPSAVVHPERVADKGNTGK